MSTAVEDDAPVPSNGIRLNRSARRMEACVVICTVSEFPEAEYEMD